MPKYYIVGLCCVVAALIGCKKIPMDQCRLEVAWQGATVADSLGQNYLLIEYPDSLQNIQIDTLWLREEKGKQHWDMPLGTVTVRDAARDWLQEIALQGGKKIRLNVDVTSPHGRYLSGISEWEPRARFMEKQRHFFELYDQALSRGNTLHSDSLWFLIESKAADYIATHATEWGTLALFEEFFSGSQGVKRFVQYLPHAVLPDSFYSFHHEIEAAQSLQQKEVQFPLTGFPWTDSLKKQLLLPDSNRLQQPFIVEFLPQGVACSKAPMRKQPYIVSYRMGVEQPTNGDDSVRITPRYNTSQLLYWMQSLSVQHLPQFLLVDTEGKVVLRATTLSPLLDSIKSLYP